MYCCTASNGVFVGRVSRAYVQHFVMSGTCYVPDAYDTRYVLYRYLFIRAKRVSNCYMQEKKTDRLSGCVSGCSDNLGFSVEKLSWF